MKRRLNPSGTGSKIGTFSTSHIIAGAAFFPSAQELAPFTFNNISFDREEEGGANALDVEFSTLPKTRHEMAAKNFDAVLKRCIFGAIVDFSVRRFHSTHSRRFKT
mmetsp:Transcript_14922/g.31225  ORF Transcript_14922/g.31225 Transcript_14922/m.31225 type:complete len:106 (+) Transcript_14922:800-1117(+)